MFHRHKTAPKPKEEASADRTVSWFGSNIANTGLWQRAFLTASNTHFCESSLDPLSLGLQQLSQRLAHLICHT